MTKHLLTALISSIVTVLGLYAVQPINAAVPPAPDMPAPQTAGWPVPSVLAMPAPQAPFDMTPITPFETVGGVSHEP